MKDCSSSNTDDDCGGLAESWEATDLYSSAKDCCGRLWWIDQDKCTL